MHYLASPYTRQELKPIYNSCISITLVPLLDAYHALTLYHLICLGSEDCRLASIEPVVHNNIIDGYPTPNSWHELPNIATRRLP
jgi:hypothetical protein